MLRQYSLHLTNIYLNNTLLENELSIFVGIG